MLLSSILDGSVESQPYYPVDPPSVIHQSKRYEALCNSSETFLPSHK